MSAIGGVFLKERMLDLVVCLLIEIDDVNPLALLCASLHAVDKPLFVQEEPVRLNYRHPLNIK